MEHKDPRILELLHGLKASMPAGTYQIVDHWDADACAIGIASRGDPRRLIYVSTYDQEGGKYAYECEAPMGGGSDEYQVVDQGQGLEIHQLLQLTATDQHASRSRSEMTASATGCFG